MKTKFHLIAGVAMIAALASCSSDDLVGNPEVKLPTDMTTAYAKVNIAMKGSDTRADDPQFDQGIADESKVNSLTLVLYGGSGNVVAYGSVADPNSAISDGRVPNNAAGAKVVELTVVPGVTNITTAAQKVVAYVNMDADVTLTLAEAQAKIVDAAGIGTDGNLAMTNSGYFTGSDWTIATDVVAGSVYTSEVDANKSNAASTLIYVERLAAKVTTSLKTGDGVDWTTANENLNVASINIVKANGEAADVKLVFDAQNAKWAPTGTAKKMYALKNQWTETLTWANLEGYSRSFWAKAVNYGETNGDYDAWQNAEEKENRFNYLSSNALRGSAGNAMASSTYTTEHTFGEKIVGATNYNPLGIATSVIVLGQYKLDGADANTYKVGEKYDFYLLQMGAGAKDTYKIFTKAELIDYLFNSTNGGEIYKDDEHTTVLSKSEVTLYWTGEKYTLKIADDGKIYDKTGTEIQFYTSNARHYNEGYAYFYALIKHQAEEVNAVGQYGVVRNHSYNLTINSIKSLGLPLDDGHYSPDPEEGGEGENPIIPDPTTAAYLDAVINVLSWHVINQGVDL